MGKATGTNILSKEAIREVEDVTEKPLEVPEWKGSVVIRSVTKREMNVIKEAARDQSGDINEDLLEKGIFLAGVKQPVFEETDYEWLLDKSFSALQRITKAILETSNLNEQSLKKEERTFRTR